MGLPVGAPCASAALVLIGEVEITSNSRHTLTRFLEVKSFLVASSIIEEIESAHGCELMDEARRSRSLSLMGRSPRIAYGWCPDVSDMRDHTTVDRFTSEVESCVDLREQGLEPMKIDARGVDATCALSVIGMIDWQGRKWWGTPLDASASFLHQLTTRVTGGGGIQGVSLRSSLKTMTRFGAPPDRMWPNRSEWFSKTPASPELFGFVRPFQQLAYLRLDPWSLSPTQRLVSIRHWIASGNPCLLGFAVPANIFSDGTEVIPFDLDRGGTRGGTACIVFGYDDCFPLPQRIRHPTISGASAVAGAFLIKTCWGEAWGNQGYAWLPYAYVESRFACDAWAVMHPNWG